MPCAARSTQCSRSGPFDGTSAVSSKNSVVGNAAAAGNQQRHGRDDRARHRAVKARLGHAGVSRGRRRKRGAKRRGGPHGRLRRGIIHPLHARARIRVADHVARGDLIINREAMNLARREHQRGQRGKKAAQRRRNGRHLRQADLGQRERRQSRQGRQLRRQVARHRGRDRGPGPANALTGIRHERRRLQCGQRAHEQGGKVSFHA